MATKRLGVNVSSPKEKEKKILGEFPQGELNISRQSFTGSDWMIETGSPKTAAGFSHMECILIT